ncbi:HAD family hydrolase [Sphingomonas aliaeris]|uniref:HAD family hydrolase n=1 Tax=Sphingomonas aliaeris TaxID=2759526 RepID=UPI0021F18148|nr:HAD-IIB family hydrolase [Sphingomonas aliaeris]
MSETEAIRLVVSDVDGTLVDKQKQLTPATIRAVHDLRDAGVGFTIISARPRSGMMPIAQALEIDAPMGAFNGGTIFHRDGTVVRQEFVPRRVVEGCSRWRTAWMRTSGSSPTTSGMPAPRPAGMSAANGSPRIRSR